MVRVWKTRNAYTFSLVGMEFEYRLDWQIIQECVVMGYVVMCEVCGVWLRELAAVRCVSYVD